VAGSGPLLLAVAAALRRAGARIVGVAEQAPLSRLTTFGAGLVRQPGKIVEGLGHAAALLGVPYRVGAWVCEAEGRDAVGRALLTDGVREWAWDCDVLACSFGLVPNLELPRLLGCETTAHGVAVDVRQRTSVAGVFAAGELGGIAGVGHALATGALAGLAAAGLPVPWSLSWRRASERRFAGWLARAFSLRAELLALADLTPSSAAARTSRPDGLHGRFVPRGQAAHASRHGRLPGPRLRPGARRAARWEEGPCARRSSPSRCPSWRKTHEVARRHSRHHDPVRADLSVDAGLLVKQVDAVVRAGCTGVVALGSLGEGGSLSFDEKKAVLRLCREALAGRAPLVAGVAATTTADAIRLAELGADAGCDGLMVLLPTCTRATGVRPALTSTR